MYALKPMENKMEVYIITDQDLGNRPIICASSRDIAIQQLFDYMGWDGEDNDQVIYNGFKEHDYHEEENERSCIGTFTFHTCYTTYVPKKWEEDKYHLYELTLDQQQK